MPYYKPPFTAKSSNPLKSYFLYEHRRWYKEKTTEIFDNVNPNYIDLWYDVPFYGKIDTKGKIVIPNTNKIIYPLNHQQGITGFDFLIKAIDEYKFFLERGTAGGKTKLANLLNNFKVKRCFVNIIDEVLNENVSSLMAFNTLIYENIHIKRKILNFQTYVCEMINFFRSVDQDFTLYKIFSSDKASIASTGLSFEFAKENYDDDKPKNPYFKDPEFYKFMQISANFGFRVNKNAPWMLIADINSQPMMGKNGYGRIVKRGYDPATQKIKEIKVPGYIQEKMIPDLETFFDEYYHNAMQYSYFLFVLATYVGYSEYRTNIQYIADHRAPRIDIKKNFKKFTGSGISRPAEIIKQINKFSLQTLDETFFINNFEKVLKYEFKESYTRHGYNYFYKMFQNKLKTNPTLTEIMDMLENYYTPARIDNPETNKPSWTTPKEPLTTTISSDSIQFRSRPFAGDVVTKYISKL